MNKLLKVGILGSSLLYVKNNLRNKSYPYSVRSPLLIHAEELKQPPDTKSKECILVIGTTGTGKSSTIRQVTGHTVRVSSSAESVTRQCEVFTDPRSGDGGAVWIDTVGYDDTGNKDDEEIFRNILKFIQSHDLTKVRAIVWTVLPQERRDARMQRQAEFINRFREENIWANVIIIVKQPGPGQTSLERTSQGSVEAARMFSEQGITGDRVMGFTYLDDSVPPDFQAVLDSLDADKRRSMLYLSSEEVNARVREAVSGIREPVKVIFEDSQCEDCGVIGDKRLLPDFCHMERIYDHPQPLKHFHPEELRSYHPLPEETHHPGVLRLTGGPHETCETVKTALLAMTPVMGLLRDTGEGLKTGLLAGAAYLTCYNLHTPMRFTFGCCGGDEASGGCRVSHQCCRRQPGSQGCLHSYPCCAGGPQAGGCTRRYHCCGRGEGALGCSQICKKCGAEWGSSANGCFKKNHNLTTIAC